MLEVSSGIFFIIVFKWCWMFKNVINDVLCCICWMAKQCNISYRHPDPTPTHPKPMMDSTCHLTTNKYWIFQLILISQDRHKLLFKSIIAEFKPGYQIVVQHSCLCRLYMIFECCFKLWYNFIQFWRNIFSTYT